MYRTEGVLALLALYLGLAQSFSWDVVVAGGAQLEFYDSNGTRTLIEDIPAGYFTSLAYDPVHNCVLFADQGWNNYSISSFNIATKKIIILVSVDKSAYVQIAYDPITSLLFWSEPDSGSIYSILTKRCSNAVVQNHLIKDNYEYVYGITAESCGGYIYWGTDRKIERARFDGSEREVVIDKNVYRRGGIAIDQQTQKMYWLDNVDYAGVTQVTIESADLNGENRTTLCSIEKKHYIGGALVVSKDFIYWRTDKTFSQLTRNPPHDKEVKPEQFLLADPTNDQFRMAMTSNYKIEDQTQGIKCGEAQNRLLPINTETYDGASINVSTDVSLLCVHGTKVSGESRCECTQGYIGERCEVSACHNYCFQGDCNISTEGQPKCRCNASYSGERCEVSVCQNYCFQGDCSAGTDGQLMCRCKAGYSGERCEVNACHEYCLNNGVCSLNEESEPVCQCTGDYQGTRCDVPVFLVKCLQTFSLLRDILNTDVVVGGKNQLEFYDHNGTRTHIEDIPSHDIRSIAYDPVHNRVLFVDQTSENTFICSFNIATRKKTFLVNRIPQAVIWVAYDPATQLLFWTETGLGSSNSILSKPGYTNAVEQNVLIKLDGVEHISCITVDSCGGYIYWGTNSKIERARFDGSEREVVINKYSDERGGIAIDQETQKMYWIDNVYFVSTYQMSIESADLNGENRRTLYIETDGNRARGLLVSKDFIYWRRYETFSQLTKNPPHGTEVEPKQFLLVQRSYPEGGMASKHKIEDQTQGIQNCEEIISETNDCAPLTARKLTHEKCVNGTKISGEPRCECTQGYIGERCEVSVCHNYCLQGDCSVSAEGQPKCRCSAGFSGERCEVNANNTLKGWRIDMDLAMAKFTDDIKGTLRGWHDEMEISMSQLNDSMKYTIKQEINTLRCSEYEKTNESDRTVTYDVSKLKSSA